MCKQHKLIFLPLASLLLACSYVGIVDEGISSSQQSLALTSENANKLFDDIFDDILSYYPEYQTALGIKDNNDQWNNYSEAFAEQVQGVLQQHRATLQRVDADLLDTPTRLSLQLYQRELTEKIEAYQWRPP